MSSRTKKVTLAQLRADKEERERGLMEGIQLVENVSAAYNRMQSLMCSISTELRYGRLNELLIQAKRACELLQNHPQADAYIHILRIKAAIHIELGQQTAAAAALEKMDEH